MGPPTVLQLSVFILLELLAKVGFHRSYIEESVSWFFCSGNNIVLIIVFIAIYFTFIKWWKKLRAA